MMDSSNMFAVGVTGDKLVVLRPLIHYEGVRLMLTREEALNLAAWLSVLADPEGKNFERLVEEIKNT